MYMKDGLHLSGKGAAVLVVPYSFSILTFSSPWSTSPSGCARSPLAGMIAPSSD